MAHPLTGQVGRHADSTGGADLGERPQQLVVARVNRERGLVDDPPRLVDVVVGLLDSGDVGDLRQLGQQVGVRG